LSKKKLYGLLLFVSLAAYAWILFNLNTDKNIRLNLCWFKYISGIPCPACGTTRSVLLILHGAWAEALYLNPLGWIAALLLFIMPFWLGYDLIFKKESIYKSYYAMEQQFNNKKIALSLLLLVLFNWIWNIYKQL